jgi:hypothetical protein
MTLMTPHGLFSTTRRPQTENASDQGRLSDPGLEIDSQTYSLMVLVEMVVTYPTHTKNTKAGKVG